MAANASLVTAGKPKVAGGIYYAPAGSTLPTDTSTALDNAFILLGYISTHGLLSQLGLFLGIGTVCSMLIVLLVLPGMLFLLDGLIQRTTRNAAFYDPKKEGEIHHEPHEEAAGHDAEPDGIADVPVSGECSE